MNALTEIDIKIPVIGLMKDENHRTNSILFDNNEIILDKTSNLFKFLCNVQDEVHRYAISFHHNVHGKNLLGSKFDQIKGIGKVKKRMIMEILGDVNFEAKLMDLPLTNLQKEEILKISVRNGIIP